jgi:hypothetical protein
MVRGCVIDDGILAGGRGTPATVIGFGSSGSGASQSIVTLL